MATFNTESFINFGFTHDMDSIFKNIDAAEYTTGSTNIAKNLNHAYTTFFTMASNKRTRRRFSKRMILIFTDGQDLEVKFTDISKVQKDVTVVPIGVGSKVNNDILDLLAVSVDNNGQKLKNQTFSMTYGLIYRFIFYDLEKIYKFCKIFFMRIWITY